MAAPPSRMVEPLTPSSKPGSTTSSVTRPSTHDPATAIVLKRTAARIDTTNGRGWARTLRHRSRTPRRNSDGASGTGPSPAMGGAGEGRRRTCSCESAGTESGCRTRLSGVSRPVYRPGAWSGRPSSSTTGTWATSARQVVYDLDHTDEAVEAAVADLMAAETFACFGPDTLAEARNRGYRLARSSRRARVAAGVDEATRGLIRPQWTSASGPAV